MTQLQLSALTSDERRILDRLVGSGVEQYDPEISPLGVTYNVLEDMRDKLGSVRLHEILESLTEKGFLSAEDIDHAIFCPSCVSPHVYTKYVCPKCNSSHVLRITLIQHLFCGYQGNKDSFQHKGQLICPKCSTGLGPEEGKPKGDGSREDYRVIGSTFSCEKCDLKFDRPLMIHYCPQCGSNFDSSKTLIRKLYSYKLKPETLLLLRQDPEVEKILTEITLALTTRGFKATRQAEVKGLSGSSHIFDIIGEKVGSKLLFDVTTLGNQNDLVTLLGKKIDIGNSPAFLIDLRGVEELSNLGKVYGIPVLNAKHVFEEELVKHLTEMDISNVQGKKGLKKG
jgi:Zn finger protein HypA/HybF involved in hydrogenase expression